MRDIRNDQQDRTNMIVASMAAPFAGLASAQEFGGIRRVAPLDPRSATPAGDHQMRDIRDDLQDRANLIEEQIKTAQAQFDALIEQIKREHDSRVEDLKAELNAVNAVISLEQRRLGNEHAQPQSQAPRPQHLQAEPARRRAI